METQKEFIQILARNYSYNVSAMTYAEILGYLYGRLKYRKEDIDKFDKVWYIGKEIYGNEFRVRLDMIEGFNESTEETRQSYRDQKKAMDNEVGLEL